MEKILNDSFYAQCRKFIQDHIQDEFITEEIKYRLINIYSSLTPENSKQLLELASRLVMEPAINAYQDFQIEDMKVSGMIILGGIILQPLRLVKSKYLNNTADIGLGIAGFGVIMFLAVGH